MTINQAEGEGTLNHKYTIYAMCVYTTCTRYIPSVYVEYGNFLETVVLKSPHFQLDL